jgi:glycosyltransferase involved in cell wall biosynthesis
MENKIKIALFKPHNARAKNAFYTGQHPVFKYLQENLGYKIAYFIEGDDVNFDGVNVKKIKRNNFVTFVFKCLKFIFLRLKFYWKIPYYGSLDFSGYDIVITEGIHYSFLDYFKNISQKVILNDSKSQNFTTLESQKRYLNYYFKRSLAVVVNEKIPFLYEKSGLKIKTETIGHSVDARNISFVKRSSCEGKLVSVGRLSEEKGFEYIIEAVALIKSKYPKIKLDIYGEGPLKNKLLGLIKSFDLEDNVFLKGFLSYKDLTEIFKQYDIFVSHPLETSYIAEAFSMANMEAMASGLPVITTDCGGVPYIVKDKALILPQKDVKGIAEKIDFFIKNPSEVQSYSANGRKYVEENFSIEVIAKKWDKVIKEQIKNARISSKNI